MNSTLTETTAAQAIGGFAARLTFQDLPHGVVDSVTQRVLDTLGICAAAAPMDTSRAVRRLACRKGGRPEATAIGVRTRVPATQAAFVNGVLAHSLDYDDTHLPSILHPSASIVPAVLAAAEARGASGADVVTAIAVGLEVCVRLGMAGYDEQRKNSLFFEHGQHATSICGAMGAAAAVASFDRNPETVVHALGVAASMASGIIEANRTGGTVKRIHCGWSAQAAVSAVELVREGLSGPPTVLEGRFGFFRAWLHQPVDTHAITDELGARWSIEDIFFKPYPANHFTHTAIDAAARMRRSGVAPEQIRRLELRVPAPNVRTIGEPIEVKRAPRTGYMAQFSGPYAVVAGLLGGGGLEVGLDDFTDELAQDPERRALMAKVDVVADERCTEIFPRQFPAVLVATLTDGTQVVEEVFSNRGGNENPLSFEDLSRKFDDNARRVLDEDGVERTKAGCRDLPLRSDIGDLLADLALIDPWNEE